MSSGIGWLQREILETLDDAKSSGVHYQGGNHFWMKPGSVVSRGREWQMPADVYDLRASLKFLAKKHGAITHCDFVAEAFRCAFSRAVRRLIATEKLNRADCAGWPQRRFVSRVKGKP